VKKNEVPAALDLAHILPPHFSMIVRQIDRPTPMPSLFVLTNAVKRFAATS